ncbi:MAG: hypothetical protein QG585_449 [Patescibacteria group bacterium]|nr:hypothetical protein [Patescibacteria group bacterium]
MVGLRFLVPSIGVSLGWDPSARPEPDEARWGREIFQQKNICDRVPVVVHLKKFVYSAGGSSNGRTTVFGTVYRGSSPCPPANLS